MKLVCVLLLLLLLVLVTAAPADQKETKKPLVWRGKQHRWMADDLKAYHEQMRKVHKNYIPSYPDAPILVSLNVGTPSVYFVIARESGSEAMFLLAKDYPGRNVSANQPFYDPTKSSTSKYAGNYTGFSGELEATGSAYDDVFGIYVDADYVTITQRFGVVNAVYDFSSINPTMPDGVMGFSWDPADAANPTSNSSAILNFFKGLDVSERYWVECLLVDTDPDLGRAYTLFTSFGENFGAFCQEPTADRTYPLEWLPESRSLAFSLFSFTYNGQELDGGYAKVDTGVPSILMPNEAFQAIYNDVQPAYDFDYGIYTVDCSKADGLPDWVFSIGLDEYAIPSSAYVVDLLLPNGQCVLSAEISDADTTDYVFGYIFHTLWCVKMDIDNQAISFMDLR